MFSSNQKQHLFHYGVMTQKGCVISSTLVTSISSHIEKAPQLLLWLNIKLKAKRKRRELFFFLRNLRP